MFLGVSSKKASFSAKAFRKQCLLAPVSKVLKFELIVSSIAELVNRRGVYVFARSRYVKGDENADSIPAPAFVDFTRL
jgi:hypothetical protein